MACGGSPEKKRQAAPMPRHADRFSQCKPVAKTARGGRGCQTERLSFASVRVLVPVQMHYARSLRGPEDALLARACNGQGS